MIEDSDETRVAERRAERARADLGETLSALKDKLSFSSVWDELGGQLTSRDASRFVSNLAAQVRDNPMPLLMVGAGLAWLMMSGRGSHGYGHDYTMPAHGGQGVASGMAGRVGESMSAAGERAGEAASSAAQGVRDMAERAGEAVSSATQSMTESVGSMTGQASEAMGSAAQSMSQSAQAMGEAASDTMHGLAGGASQMGTQARETFSELLERQPLIIGALAVALGAAIGAALPSTSFENEQLGETSDELKEQIAERGETVLDRGASVVSRVYETAREEIGAAATEAAQAAKSDVHQASDVLESGGAPSQRP